MDKDIAARWMALGPITWGKDDALMLVADELQRAMGADPIPDIRGMYASEAGHHAFLAAMGGSFLRAVLRGVRARRGWSPVKPDAAPAMAVGLARIGLVWTIGLRLANGWWAFRVEGGAAFLPGGAIKRAWTWQP